MKTYENNMADQALVVKSLKVLEKIDGGGIKEIRQSVDAVRKQALAMSRQQEEYWTALSDDGVISVIEKQNLKREMESIRQSYSAVTTQAVSLGYSNPILQDYTRTYNTLRDYLYNTLKVFDDMTEETPINDRAYFNSLFSNYFYMESFVLLAITKGVLDTVAIRVLDNLEEEGEENELALYRGAWYQHIDGHWKNVTTGSYKGAQTSMPVTEEGSFFLAAETFVILDTLYVNGEELYVNGEMLGITNYAYKGYIYYCTNGVWFREEDKTNWRYAAAFADVINVTGELPEIFQNAIDDLQDQITDAVTTLQEEITTRRGQYTIIDNNIVRIDQSLYDLNSDTVANTADIASQAQSLRDQAAELRSQAQALTEQAASISSLDDTVTDQQEALSDLDSTVTTQGTTLSNLGDTVTGQGENIADLLARAAALEAQADELDAELATKVSHLPEYLGPSAVIPDDALEGDFFVYSGANSGTWYFANVYRKTANGWERLLSSDAENNSYYMMALADILTITPTTDGYFNTVFSDAFFTNNATMQSLSTRTIYLRQGGYIQSDNVTYEQGKLGLNIDYRGNIDANGDVHFGASVNNKVAIGVPLKQNGQYTQDFNDYDVVIGGRTKFKGALEGATGSFSGECNVKGLNLEGIQPGDIVMKSISASYGWVAHDDTAYKFVGTGTYRLKIGISASALERGFSSSVKIYRNNSVFFEKNYSESSYSEYIEIDEEFSFGDIIKIILECDPSRVGGAGLGVSVDICTDSKNELMSLLSEPYVVS